MYGNPKGKCLSITSSLLSAQSAPEPLEPEVRFADLDIIISPPSQSYRLTSDIILH